MKRDLVAMRTYSPLVKTMRGAVILVVAGEYGASGTDADWVHSSEGTHGRAVGTAPRLQRRNDHRRLHRICPRWA